MKIKIPKYEFCVGIIFSLIPLFAVSERNVVSNYYCIGNHVWESIGSKKAEAYKSSLALNFMIGVRGMFGAKDVWSLEPVDAYEAGETLSFLDATAIENESNSKLPSSQILVYRDKSRNTKYSATEGNYLGHFDSSGKFNLYETISSVGNTKISEKSIDKIRSNCSNVLFISDYEGSLFSWEDPPSEPSEFILNFKASDRAGES